MCVKFNKEYFLKFQSQETLDKIVDLETIVQLLNHVRRNYGSLNAIAKPDGTLVTFNQMLNDVAKVSTYFKSQNITDRNVGIYCSNGYWFEVLSLGIMASGNVACLLPINFNEKMVQDYCSMLDINTVFVDNDNLKNIETKHIKQLMMIDPLLNPFNHDINKDQAAAILLTGGTTGKPKGAILSHKNLMAGTINGCWGVFEPFNQVYYCILPLTHSFGFIRNMLCALYTGSLIYYNQDKKDIFADLAKYKPTMLVIVPALAELFLNLVNGVGPQVLGGNVKCIISGAANVPPYLGRGYKKLGIDFCPGYGLTECSNIVSGCHFDESCPDTVGTIFPGQEGKIVDGELWLRGTTLFKGYYNNQAETDKVMVDGWFKTGDLAKFDENGYLYILGRIKEIIVLPSGENVSPAYIESKVNKLDLIQDSLVYDEQNSFGNTELVCEVTLRPLILKKLGLEKDKIKPYIQKHIDEVNKTLLTYEHINKIIIRDKDFDRSPAMKILRKKK